MKRPSVSNQGTIAVKRSSVGYVIGFPNGDVDWAPTHKAAETAAKRWFRKHMTADIGVGKIEWSEV